MAYVKTNNDNNVVCIISSDDDDSINDETKTKSKKISDVIRKRKSIISKSPNQDIIRKRIKPIKLSDTVSKSIDDENFLIENDEHNEQIINKNDDETEQTIINSEFQLLLSTCRLADPTNDMDLLINKKLLPYYSSVHPDFINSKSFCKTVQSVTNDIKLNPGLVYLKITGIIDELKIRRKSKNIVVTNEEITTTGCEIKDQQIKRLNKALYFLKRKIAELEESEVDFEEDTNSTYLQEQRYKRRACEIYEKICDITGESKHAHRSVRKPISFHGTMYPEFNKAIQTFVNRTNTFPDYFDVIKCLQYCNNQYGFKLSNDDMIKIAQDAFVKIGKLLQNRRKADLYETVSHFVGTKKDPAIEDPTLLGKLSENKKYHSRIGAIIDKYANEQDEDKIQKNIEKETIKETNRNNDKNLLQTTNDEVASIESEKSLNNNLSESDELVSLELPIITDDDIGEDTSKIPIVILDDEI